MTKTYINNKAALLQTFFDGESGKIYARGRLLTRDMGDRVELVAYTKQIIASVSKDGNDVHIYTGHFERVSETVTQYYRDLGRELNKTEGKTVVSEYNTAPLVKGYDGELASAQQYIGQYFDVRGKRSAIEENAVKAVERILNRRAKELVRRAKGLVA